VEVPAPRNAIRNQGALGLALAVGPLAARLLAPTAPGSFALPRNILPQCLVHQLTGLPCPTCGLTRSFAAMAGGDVARALRFHPLGPALFVGAVALGAGLCVAALFSRRFRLRLTPREQNASLACLTGLLLAFWVARLMGGF
jgi:hypothetical protein